MIDVEKGVWNLQQGSRHLFQHVDKDVGNLVMNEVLVHKPEELTQCCQHLAQCKRFGFDTEFVGEDSYHPRLCLIQVATTESLFLIDPFALENLGPFWNLVIDPAHEVIVHAGREEVRLCHIFSGQVPGRLFDLQITAGLVGLPYPMGHGPLVAHVLGQKLAKAETLTEWRTRPLTHDQIHYAFDDVRYLLPLWEQLSRRLEDLGRTDWAAEEFARLSQLSTPDEEGLSVSAEKWRKLRGANSLDRRRLAILREIFYWREKEAADLNRPPRTLVRDDLLVEITRRNPKSAKDLQPVRGLAKRHLEDIFQAIEKARNLAPDELPPLIEREVDPPQQLLLVNLLGAQLAHLAERLHIAGNLVANNQELRMLVRSRIQGAQPPARSLLHQGWRAAHLLPHLQAMLDGRISLRVGDIQKEVPFVFDAEM
jgi:ribonuclease D